MFSSFFEESKVSIAKLMLGNQPGDIKITGKDWDPRFFFVPGLYDKTNNMWYGVNEAGTVKWHRDDGQINWRVWTPPPTKHIVFEYMVKYKNKRWTVLRELRTEAEMIETYSGQSDCKYQKTGRQFEVEK